MRLFISYARIDKPFCIQLVDTLEVHDIWYDQRLYAGQHWWKEILRRLEWSEAFIYLLSADSVKSDYCLKELAIALRLGRPIIPVVIHDEVHIPSDLAELQYVDMSRGLTVENVKNLLNAIYLAEQEFKNQPSSQSDITQIENDVKSSPISKSAKIVSMAAQALQKADYDRAILLFKQAKEAGFQSRFINIDRLLEEAERALEAAMREREARREYINILELYQIPATRKMACEAFLEFRKEFPNFDPKNLAKVCLVTVEATQKSRASIPAPSFFHDSHDFPLLEWCDIPAGVVYLEDPHTHQDKRVSLQEFYISKYPVTNQQFDLFFNDPNGYCNPQWWRFSKTAFRWLREHPQPLKPHFSGDDRPRETVNFYEAVAFTNWLSSELEMNIMLPTLAQWQRAALGDDERLFPWGNNFHPDYCNTRENGLRMTTSVMRYDKGVSPFGVYDMAGNIWEWCLDKLEPDDGGVDFKRAVIGGSYVSPSERALPSFRYFLNPEARYSSIGFRVIRLANYAYIAGNDQSNED